MDLKDCLLGDVVTFQRGHDLPKAQMVDGPYPVLGSNGIIGYHNRYTTTGPVIVVGRSGNVGHPFMVKSNAWAHNTSLYIKDFKGNDPIFIYYFLQTLNLAKFAGGSAVPTLNRNHINTIEVKIPKDVSVQKKIGSILASFDEKISTNNKINDNLQHQAQSIYNHFFEKIDVFNLPSEWRVVSLGEVATISSKTFNPQKEPFTILEHYSIPAFDETKFPVFEPSSNIKSNKFIVDSSCLLISKLNPTTKRVWRPYCLSEHAVCSTEFIVYRANDKIYTDYLYSVIDSQSFTNHMCSHVNGTTGSRQRTTPSDTLSYEFVLPSRDVLEKFQSIVSPMYNLISINAIENYRLKQLRETLLPKLLSGKVDVKSII